jgi:hypothetical protein
MSDNNTDAGGFFSRWSQRKQAVKQGVQLPEPLVPATASPHSLQTQAPVEPVQQQATVENQNPPTLDDVAKLTPESDFSSFMTQNVPSEIKNAAVKKLFADPHFNIMDGLDIYIGDYNTPDPLPAGMLAKMVGAQFLGLVKAPEDVAQSGASSADIPITSAAKLSAPAETAVPTEITSTQHDHTHLRLQSDDAPANPEAGSGTG